MIEPLFAERAAYKALAAGDHAAADSFAAEARDAYAAQHADARSGSMARLVLFLTTERDALAWRFVRRHGARVAQHARN